MDPHSFILPAVFFKCGSWSGPRYRFHHEKLQLTWIQFQIPVSGSESGSAFKKNLWIRIRKKTKKQKKNADPQPGSAIVFLSTTFCFGCGSWSGHGYRIYKKNFSCFSFYFSQILAKMNTGSRFRCPDPDQDLHKKKCWIRNRRKGMRIHNLDPHSFFSLSSVFSLYADLDPDSDTDIECIKLNSSWFFLLSSNSS